uniref:Protein alcS n=1 Tax=Talaromyces marneffei PM1 TaxID=1077442 RepID=A0A093VI90_TALMA
MSAYINQNNESTGSIHEKDITSHNLSRSVTLTAEQFEKLYLAPMIHGQPKLTKQLGNPTPLALGGFVITTTPLSCALMAWRGAGGNGLAFIGSFVFLGGLLVLITSILEFILGNTFSCVVFGTVGSFWLAYAATMIPSFNAVAPYSATLNNTAAGMASPQFQDTFVFCLLAAGDWTLAEGNEDASVRCIKGAGALLFASSLLGFYLLTSVLLESLQFPFRLPVGDLSGLWTCKGRKRHGADSANTRANSGNIGDENA